MRLVTYYLMIQVSGTILSECDKTISCYRTLGNRTIWIHEVPLDAVPHLQEMLNSVPEGQKIPDDALDCSCKVVVS